MERIKKKQENVVSFEMEKYLKMLEDHIKMMDQSKAYANKQATIIGRDKSYLKLDQLLKNGKWKYIYKEKEMYLNYISGESYNEFGEKTGKQIEMKLFGVLKIDNYDYQVRVKSSIWEIIQMQKGWQMGHQLERGYIFTIQYTRRWII
ncbi:unnamed protein product [Paramecium octaurelia]|uniref:Uncharacterized protein n=1 Tax=Paramecium octaurelia TaxID=43137 RepID=A0A8S1YRY4_PAROT|nr:unnamed protein product [Paramecium octaurelia]